MEKSVENLTKTIEALSPGKKVMVEYDATHLGGSRGEVSGSVKSKPNYGWLVVISDKEGREVAVSIETVTDLLVG